MLVRSRDVNVYECTHHVETSKILITVLSFVRNVRRRRLLLAENNKILFINKFLFIFLFMFYFVYFVLND